MSRSKHRRCSIEKFVPKNFTKITGRHLCQSLFFETWHLVFSSEFCKIFKKTFFTEQVWTTASVCRFIFLNNSLQLFYVVLFIRMLIYSEHMWFRWKFLQSSITFSMSVKKAIQKSHKLRSAKKPIFGSICFKIRGHASLRVFKASASQRL